MTSFRYPFHNKGAIMAKSKSKTIKKNQIKISKKCKDLNKLKQLKINENIRKLLQKDYCTKRSTSDRIVNKLKGLKKLLSRNN